MRPLTAAIVALALTSPVMAAPSDTFEAVCQSKAIKSEPLQTACSGNDQPEPLKDQSRFKNVGIGAEINVLARNIEFFKAANN